MYVCVCRYMYMYTCVDIYIYIYTHTHTQVCVDVRLYMCVCVYIYKLRLQILETLHIKTKRPKINRINFEKSDSFKMPLFFLFFLNIPYFLIIFYFC